MHGRVALSTSYYSTTTIKEAGKKAGLGPPFLFKMKKALWYTKKEIKKTTPIHACPLCAQKEFVFVTRENGLSILRCKCGLYFVNPQPSEEDLYRFYNDYVTREMAPAWARASLPSFRRDRARITHYVKRGKLLDIGCGFGFFLKLMEDSFYVYGCDLSPAMVDYAKTQLGLKKVVLSSWKGLSFPENTFDVITAFYLLTHIKEPDKLIKTAFRWLRPGGLFCLRVPNLSILKVFWGLKRFDNPLLRRFMYKLRAGTSLSHDPYAVFDPPSFLFHFTPSVLERFVKKVGFSHLIRFNEGMPKKGGFLNYLTNGLFTQMAEVLKIISHRKIDICPCFSIYAFKA